MLFLQQFSGGLTPASTARREARQEGGGSEEGRKRKVKGATDELDHKRKSYSPADYQWGRVDALDAALYFPQPPRCKMKTAEVVIHLSLHCNKF